MKVGWDIRFQAGSLNIRHFCSDKRLPVQISVPVQSAFKDTNHEIKLKSVTVLFYTRVYNLRSNKFCVVRKLSVMKSD